MYKTVFTDVNVFCRHYHSFRRVGYSRRNEVRLDVEDNSFKRGYPTVERPNGQLNIAKNTEQGYVYPGMDWKNSKWGSYTRGNAFDYYLSPSVSSSYTHQWGEHFFKAMAGFQMEVQEKSNGYTYKDGMLGTEIFSFANANGRLYSNEDRTHWATMGMYAKLNWNYQETYFLEFSGRYDGSSVLPRETVGDSSFFLCRL